MTFVLKISNGKTEADFMDELGSFALTEGGLKLPSPKYAGVASSPLVGTHGNSFSSIEYKNRKPSLDFSVYGSTYSELAGNLNTLSKLINEAGTGGFVDLILQVQDSNTSYLRILGGEIILPPKLLSMEGVHWMSGDIYVLHNCSLRFETAPFFTDYPSYEKEGDVTPRIVDTTVDNGGIVSITDIPGDITTETILEFVGAYSNGTQKIYIGAGGHSLATNLSVGIDNSQTTMVVDEDYSGKLLVPFVVTIESEDLQVTIVKEGVWTMTRGYNSTTPASHTATTAVTMQYLHDLDLDDGLSYCTTEHMRVGLIDSMSINTNGTDYIVNQIIILGSNMVEAVSVNAGGTGYSVDDVLTITPDGDDNCLLTVLTLSGSSVATVSITSRGTGYSTSTGSATTVAPAGGSGCTIDIDTITSLGDAKARILTVSDTGAIVTWEITDGGSGYSGSDLDVSLDDGIATFDIDEITSVSETVTASTTDDLGSNYMDIDVSGQGIHDLVEWTLDRNYVSVINQRVRLVGKEAQTANGWNTSVNYRVKVGYRTAEDSSFIEMDKTDWKTPNSQTEALFDFGSIMMPPSGSGNSAPDVTVIFQVQIKPDDAYDSSLDIIVYNLNIDFIKMIPVGAGFRYINCGVMPFFILDKLVDDSRKIAPYVQEYTSSFQGEVVVDGIMPPIRLVPSNSGNTLHFLFEDGGGTASMAMDLDVEVGVIGNYLGLVD